MAKTLSHVTRLPDLPNCECIVLVPRQVSKLSRRPWNRLVVCQIPSRLWDIPEFSFCVTNMCENRTWRIQFKVIKSRARALREINRHSLIPSASPAALSAHYASWKMASNSSRQSAPIRRRRGYCQWLAKENVMNANFMLRLGKKALVDATQIFITFRTLLCN